MALARITLANPEMFSLPTGLRLCGIADEPFLSDFERLFCFQDISALQVTNLSGKLIEAAGNDGKRAHELCVPVALNNLC